MRKPRGHAVLCAYLACALAGLSEIASAQESSSRAAAPLRTPQLRTPVEAAGTGLAPEVRLRARIDHRGRVRDVEVLSIRPSSEFDAMFEDVTRQTLSRWRYAPEIRQGKAVATRLEWTIRFPTRQPIVDEADFAYDGGQGGRIGRTGHDDPWRQILSLPEPQRRRLLDGIAQSAESHLHPQRLQRFESDRFVVATDAPKAGTARQIAEDLEATYDVMATLFAPLLAPRPASYKVLVFVYASADQFVELGRDVLRVEGAAGFYNPAGLLAFHMGLATPESVVGTMLHEAAHAFLDRHIARPGVYLPRWLGEGFAEYVGNSAIKKKRLIPGRTPRSQIYWMGQRPGLGRSEQVFGVERVRSAMRNGTAPTIERLLAAGPGTFYGADRHLFYSSSWLLVHFLRHADPAWAEREFPLFMLYVAEGYPVEQSLETVYGVSPAAFEGRFRDYVKGF